MSWAGSGVAVLSEGLGRGLRGVRWWPTQAKAGADGHFRLACVNRGPRAGTPEV